MYIAKMLIEAWPGDTFDDVAKKAIKEFRKSKHPNIKVSFMFNGITLHVKQNSTVETLWSNYLRAGERYSRTFVL